MMAVQMIRRYIQDSRYRRVEIHCGFQLKTADLRYRHAVLPGIQSFQRIRVSNIPNHKYGFVIIPHDLPGKSRCGCLSVRPGNGYHLSFGKSVAQLHFPPDRDTLVPEFFHKRGIHRNARA